MKEKFRERAEKLKTEIPALFLALRDRRTPVLAKLLAALTVAYALSPVDLIPDFIPVLGYLDDLLLLPALAAAAIRLIPDEVMDECRERARGLWKDGNPRHWYFAVPMVLFWALVIWLVLRAVL